MQCFLAWFPCSTDSVGADSGALGANFRAKCGGGKRLPIRYDRLKRQLGGLRYSVRSAVRHAVQRVA